MNSFLHAISHNVSPLSSRGGISSRASNLMSENFDFNTLNRAMVMKQHQSSSGNPFLQAINRTGNLRTIDGPISRPWQRPYPPLSESFVKAHNSPSIHSIPLDSEQRSALDPGPTQKELQTLNFLRTVKDDEVPLLPHQKEDIVNQAIARHQGNKGLNVMRNMGWKDGTVLGASGTGLTNPIVLQGQSDTTGFGYEAPEVAETTTESSLMNAEDIANPLEAISGGLVSGISLAAQQSASNTASNLMYQPSAASKVQAYNVTTGTKSMTNSAMIGGDIGSLFGPVGTLVGAGIGAMAGYQTPKPVSTTAGDVDATDYSANTY